MSLMFDLMRINEAYEGMQNAQTSQKADYSSSINRGKAYLATRIMNKWKDYDNLKDVSKDYPDDEIVTNPFKHYDITCNGKSLDDIKKLEPELYNSIIHQFLDDGAYHFFSDGDEGWSKTKGGSSLHNDLLNGLIKEIDTKVDFIKGGRKYDEEDNSWDYIEDRVRLQSGHYETEAKYKYKDQEYTIKIICDLQRPIYTYL